MVDINAMKKTYDTEDKKTKYASEFGLRLTNAQKLLIDETLKMPMHMMMGSSDALQLLTNLIRLIGAKKVLDVGVFTGCSALAAALGLPEDGRVYALEINEEYPKIGMPYWKMDGVDKKIKLILGPAVNSLEKFVSDGLTGQFDFAFIDADKPNYSNYYELCLKLIRPGGIVAVDNTLGFGQVFNPEVQSESVMAIRKLNETIKNDERVNISFLAIGDGLTLCFKK